MGLAVFPPVATCWVERGENRARANHREPSLFEVTWVVCGCLYCPLVVALVWIGVMRYGVLYMHTPLLILGRGRIG